MGGPVAVLCSGQAGQHPEMFDLIADCPACEPVFAAASEHLGHDPRRFVRQATTAELFADRAGQILCCTRALAVWAALSDGRPARAVVAGYSVGELAAWGCAGALDPSATLRLAARRADAMDAVAPPDGGMAAIVGLSRAALEPILRRHEAAIAIVVDAKSFVIGGHARNLDASCREAAALGATHIVKLNVAVPSHTKLMAGAVGVFDAALREAAPRLPFPMFRLLSGIDGETIGDVETGVEKLSRQICTPIDWAACLESCREAGAELALELGPGRALSHMAAPLFPAGRARSTEDFRTVAGLRAWPGRGGD
jgi:[acyl-carrier-protein] S-malonyltransferase